jgi:hypothetical protein
MVTVNENRRRWYDEMATQRCYITVSAIEKKAFKELSVDRRGKGKRFTQMLRKIDPMRCKDLANYARVYPVNIRL